MTLIQSINLAKALTRASANVKDWLVTNRHDRQMREIARDLNNGKGYIIATPAELANRYPGLYENFSTTTHKIIWAVDFFGWRGQKYSFLPVR